MCYILYSKDRGYYIEIRKGNLPDNIIARCANDGCGHPITKIEFYTIEDGRITNVDYKGWLISKEHDVI